MPNKKYKEYLNKQNLTLFITMLTLLIVLVPYVNSGYNSLLRAVEEKRSDNYQSFLQTEKLQIKQLLERYGLETVFSQEADTYAEITSSYFVSNELYEKYQKDCSSVDNNSEVSQRLCDSSSKFLRSFELIMNNRIEIEKMIAENKDSSDDAIRIYITKLEQQYNQLINNVEQ